MIYGMLLAYFLTCGFNVIFIKSAQKNYVNDTWDAFHFTLCYAFFQMLVFFALPPYHPYHFTLKVALYPFCFSMFSLLSQILTLSALKNGPTSLTYVLFRFSVPVSTFIGLFLWKEPFSGFQAVGLILFLVCMFLFNQDSYTEGKEKKTISLKWLIISLSSAVMTGCAVVFTKKYMVESVGPIREYLILFNAFIVIFCGFLLGFRRLGMHFHGRITPLPKPSIKFFDLVFLAAICMNIANFIYMSYIAKFSSAFFFPFTSIISMLAILILSVIILKERLSSKAQIGLVLSLAAIYLLGLH